MKIQLLKHHDTIFVIPSPWISVEDKTITASLSFLIFSVDFEFKNRDYA